MSNFLTSNQIRHLTVDGTNYALSAGTTDVNSEVLDTSGYRGVTFVWTFGDNTDTGTFTGKLQGSADGSTGWTDITGATTSFTAGASDTDNEMLAIEVYSPQYRYLRAASDRGTANTVVAALHAVLSSPVESKITQSTATGQFIQAPVFVSTF